MTWFKVDDKFWGHPKQTALPPACIALWVRAGSWSADQLTDGFVPAHMLLMLGAKKKDAEALVVSGLWTAATGGYQFHQWTQWQPTREEVHAKRTEEAERKRKWREKRAADKASAESVVPDVSQWDNRVASAGTPAGVPDLSRSSRTRPDPTRPDPSLPTEETNKSKEQVGGVSNVSNAHETPPPLYPDHCTAHAGVAEPGSCGLCKERRLANASRKTLQLVPSVFQRRPWCGECDEYTRQREYDGQPYRCPECHPLAEETA